MSSSQQNPPSIEPTLKWLDVASKRVVDYTKAASILVTAASALIAILAYWATQRPLSFLAFFYVILTTGWVVWLAVEIGRQLHLQEAMLQRTSASDDARSSFFRNLNHLFLGFGLGFPLLCSLMVVGASTSVCLSVTAVPANLSEFFIVIVAWTFAGLPLFFTVPLALFYVYGSMISHLRLGLDVSQGNTLAAVRFTRILINSMRLQLGGCEPQTIDGHLVQLEGAVEDFCDGTSRNMTTPRPETSTEALGTTENVSNR